MNDVTPGDIRPPRGAEDVALLEHYLSRDVPETHRDRFARQQEGRMTYLVAWMGERPVGHVLIKWDGSLVESVRSALPDCPELEDFYVDPAYRGRRIGMRLLEAAEALAAEHGFSHLGLSVGLAPDYDRARAIYRRRGYRNAAIASYYEGWWTLDPDGQRIWWDEAVEYLIKSLQAEEGVDD